MLSARLIPALALLAAARVAQAEPAAEDPMTDARHKLDVGDHFLDDGRIPKALEFYEWAARIAPAWWKPRYQIGTALRLAGSPSEVVLAHFREALAAAPDVYVVLVDMGEVLETGNDWAGAERYYREALQVSGPVERVLVHLGGVLLEQGKWEEAQRVLDEATRHDPGPAVFHQLARLARNLGDAQAEEGYLRILLKRAPDPAPYASRLGVLLQQTGRADGAERLAKWLSGDRRGPPPSP